PGWDLLLGIAQGQRIAAQEVLIQATRQPPLDLDSILGMAVCSLKLPPDMPSQQSLRDLAVPLLTEHLRLLNHAAQSDLHDYQHLHQVRIHGKRLRYAMEVFVTCFENSFQ